jgi:hypothetical protein
MKKLPRISGRECVKALERLGFHFRRQSFGPSVTVLYWVSEVILTEYSKKI